MNRLSRFLEFITPWHHEDEVNTRENKTIYEVRRARRHQLRMDSMLRSFERADEIIEKRKGV